MCRPSDDREKDAELILRLRHGDMAAFDALFDRYRRPIFAYVLGIVRDRGLAEDVVQECFVTVCRRIDRIDPAKGVSGWLWRTARNRSIDVLRKRRFEVLSGEEELPGPAMSGEGGRGPDDAAGALMREERRAEVMAALARLPEREREILMLHFHGDLTFREIAGTVGRPLGTVLWLARRALKALRRMLTE